MFDTYNFSGYDLYQPFDNTDQWVFDTRSGQAYHGTLKETVKYMIQKYEFSMENIEEALNLLADNISKEHNGCHFGAYKSILFTFNHGEKYGKRTA